MAESTGDESKLKLEIHPEKKFCRVCVAQDPEMLLLFDSEPNGILDKIVFCTGVQFARDDSLPSHICSTCLNNLSIAHEFKTLCLLADESFRKYIADQIKTESPNSYEDFNNEIQYDDETNVKDEILVTVLRSNGVRKSVRLKNMENDSTTDIKIKAVTTPRQRGPYKKSDKPRKKKNPSFKRPNCAQCNIIFDSKQAYEEHKKVEHKEDGSWICEFCGKVFIHRASHYTHLRSHRPPQFACPRCDYRACLKHDLLKHLRVHDGVKAYKCHLCPASYHTSSNLACHVSRFHERLRPHPCDQCDRRFADRTKLKRHLDSHNAIKRFECSICHSCFTRRCYWKRHLQRQHGVCVPAQRPGRRRGDALLGQLGVGDGTRFRPS